MIIKMTIAFIILMVYEHFSRKKLDNRKKHNG